MEDYSKYTGYALFSKAYDEVEKENPEAKLYRGVLTGLASHESSFRMSIKNPNAPAYGYFLFMLDGRKYNNIKVYSGLSIDAFLKDPKALIKAAIALAKDFLKMFKPEDFEKAKLKGITKSGLIAGAWLGGPGGVRKVLNGTGDPSDTHWSSTGAGSSVSKYILKYNNL